MIPFITLEEHFYSEAIYDSLDQRGRAAYDAIPGIQDKLKDIDGIRLQSMNNNGIHLQVISHAWQTGATPEDCRAGNDELATRIASNNRFAAFAVLPVAHPQECSTELERCIKMGFVGALIDNHNQGAYFDGPEYNTLWSKAQELDVPIYIHPSLTTAFDVKHSFEGNYGAQNASTLAMESWGWHTATGLHILRLFSAGVFDRYPRLKIIIGHMGEMLPFMLERFTDMSFRYDPRERSIIDVWRNNIWITTSGVWSVNPMRTILANTSVNHIMYSVDWPFTSNEAGKKWFQELEESGLLTTEQLEMVAYKNAERLLKVTAPLDLSQ